MKKCRGLYFVSER